MYFFVVATSSLALIYGLFGIRIIRPAPLPALLKAALWGVLGLCFAALPLCLVFRFRFPGHPAGAALCWFAFVAFGFFTLAFAAILIRDSLFLAEKMIRRGIHMLRAVALRLQGSPRKSAPCGPNPSRRLFLLNGTNLLLIGSTGVLTGYGVVQARQVPQVVSIDILVGNLPPEFDGFRILQITDLHISMTLRRDYVAAVVARAGAQAPDMIVFTGDIADGDAGDLRRDAAPLADLTAEFGKYFVTGNHEYYSGVEGWLSEVRRLGFTPLMNEHRIIRKGESRIVLAGITDYRAGRIVPAHASDPERALAEAPPNLPRILLAHQPKSIFKAAPQGVDLMVCGHTHGGQYIPWNYMVSLDQPYVYGLHRHGGTMVYVSRGTGYWGPPVRVGAPSKITVLKLIPKTV